MDAWSRLCQSTSSSKHWLTSVATYNLTGSTLGVQSVPGQNTLAAKQAVEAHVTGPHACSLGCKVCRGEYSEGKQNKHSTAFDAEAMPPATWRTTLKRTLVATQALGDCLVTTKKSKMCLCCSQRESHASLAKGPGVRCTSYDSLHQ